MGVDGNVFDEGIRYPTHVAALLLLHEWTIHSLNGLCVGGAELEGEVGGGDLESVEEDSGAFVVQLAAGDAGEDVAQGDLDGGGVVDGRDGEDGELAAIVGGGAEAAGALVVIAEVLAAEGGRAASTALGEDMTAEIAAFRVRRLSEFVLQHGDSSRVGAVPHPPYFGPKVRRRDGLGLKESGETSKG